MVCDLEEWCYGLRPDVDEVRPTALQEGDSIQRQAYLGAFISLPGESRSR